MEHLGSNDVRDGADHGRMVSRLISVRLVDDDGCRKD